MLKNGDLGVLLSLCLASCECAVTLLLIYSVYVKCYAVTPLRFVPGDGDGVGILEAIPGPWIPLEGFNVQGRVYIVSFHAGTTLYLVYHGEGMM